MRSSARVALIAAAARLWWDSAKESYRRGIDHRDPTKGGTIRRLVAVVQQFRLTYDFWTSMKPEAIIALLPREFNRWREKEAPPVPRIPSAAPKRPGLLGRLFDRP